MRLPNKVSLDMELYENGFRTEHVDCIHMPVAKAAGIFNYDFYDFFCFIYAINKNWNSKQAASSDWFGRCNKYLEYMGLQLNTYEITSKQSLVETIKKEINKKNPIIFFTSYSAIPWCSQFKLDETEHGMLITGYYEDVPMIILRDDFLLKFANNEKVNQCVEQLFKGLPSWQFQISEDVLYKLMTESNLMLRERMPRVCNQVFSIQKKEDVTIELIDYMKNLSQFVQDDEECISEVIDNQESYMNLSLSEQEQFFDILRRNLISSLSVIQECCDKAIDSLLGKDSREKEKFDDIINNQKKVRNTFVLKFHKYSYVNRKIKSDYKMELIEKENHFKECLYEITKQVIVHYEQNIV